MVDRQKCDHEHATRLEADVIRSQLDPHLLALAREVIRRQATIKAALDLGLQAWRTTRSRERFIEAHDAVNALAADLSAARAQVERRDRELTIVRSMAVNGPGPGTTPEQTLTTIAAFIDKRLAAAVPDPEEDAT